MTGETISHQAFDFSQQLFTTATPQTITTNGFLPILSSNLQIIGPPAGVIITTTNGASTATGFTVSGGTVTLQGLTLRNFRRGVNVFSGSLTVRACTIVGAGGIGAGVNMDGVGTSVTLENCTVTGAFYGVFNTTGTLTVQNCTVTGNASVGLYCDPASGNTFNLGNSIVAGNGTDVVGTLTINHLNLTGTVSQVGLDPAGLQDNGGPSPTVALVAGSPAIDAGDSPLGSDQRGVARLDIPGVPNSAGGPADIGAFEYQGNQSLVVTTLNDEDNSTADSTFGAGTSLREAIAFANFRRGPSTITFATGLAGTITLASALPNLAHDMTIQGPGANVVSVSGNNAVRVFNVAPTTVVGGMLIGPTVTISGLSIINGRATDFGAGILSFNSTVALDGLNIRNNSAVSSGAGGGVCNLASGGSAKLTVTNSTLSGNSANPSGSANTGGALLNISAPTSGGTAGNAAASLVNCTVSGNTSAQLGAVANQVGSSGQATLSLSFCTFSGNSTTSSATAAIVSCAAQPNGFARVSLDHTILNVSGGLSLRALFGTIVSQDYNLSSDATVDPFTGNTVLQQPHDQTSTNPLLGPLANNGGPTPTHALLAGSPAINAGGIGSGFDQRGVSRLSGNAQDIGAYEVAQPASYAYWAANTFPSGTPADLTAPDADYNGDGLSNGLAFVTGRDPTIAGGAPLVGALEGSNLTLTFPRSVLVDPAKLSFEQSLNLQLWTQVSPTVTDLGPAGPMTEQIKVSIPTNAAPQKFGRLRFTP